MRMTLPAVIACALLGSGCSLVPQERMLPSRSIPHRLSQSAEITVWVRRDTGELVEESVRVDPGWYVAAPEIVESPPSPPLGVSP
jgi:hypothetical protein